MCIYIAFNSVYAENVGRLKKLEYLNLALNNIEVIENLEGDLFNKLLLICALHMNILSTVSVFFFILYTFCFKVYIYMIAYIHILLFINFMLIACDAPLL